MKFYCIFSFLLLFSLLNVKSTYFLKKSVLKNNKHNKIQQLNTLDYEIIKRLTIAFDLNEVDSFLNEASIYTIGKVLYLSKEFVPKLLPNSILCASIKFNNSLTKIGWDTLYLKTYPECDPVIQMWSAGFLEGFITRSQIRDFHHNLKVINSNDKNAMNNLMNFFEEMEKSLIFKISNENIKKLDNDKEIIFWSEIALIHVQTEGLLFGYNLKSPIDKKMTMNDIYFVNADGQIPELLSIFRILNFNNNFEMFRYKQRKTMKKNQFSAIFKEYKTKNPEYLWEKLMSTSHCSAFIKVLKDSNNQITDVLLSHSTWDDYSAMIRVFKHYDFNLFDQKENSNNKIMISFSSYPGCLTSTDDFYIINGRLLVMETSLEVLNRDVYKKILKAKDYIPDYMRILVANRNSYSTKEWVNWIQHINTGTYNTQWMIFDLQKARKSRDLNEENLNSNTFILAEQVPGKVIFKDLSEKLSKDTYWAAFNVPFLPESRKILGYEDMTTRYGTHSFSFPNNPRNLIFKSFQNSISSVEDVKQLMQYNPWDPKQSNNIENLKLKTTNNPTIGIAARFDLAIDQSLKKNNGAIDTKITNLSMSKDQICVAISGPTHQKLPPFQWSLAMGSDPKDGLPDLWNFDWVEMKP